MFRWLKTVMIVWCALSQSLLLSGRVMAQYSAPLSLTPVSSDLQRVQYGAGPQYTQGIENVDVEPPLIEHEVVTQAEADIRQTFVATVVDDENLQQVLFFYRYSGETSYSRYVMNQLSSSSTYVAQIPTNPDNLAAIEYYIQAQDTSGNRTIRGYRFSPLVREIVEPAALEPVAGSGDAGTGSAAESQATSGVPKIAYIIGGVLLLGLIAGAAGGGSGGGSGTGPVSGGPCGADGCRLTVTVNPPY